jgi:ABC-type multidrug transport system ATPase subunit
MSSPAYGGLAPSAAAPRITAVGLTALHRNGIVALDDVSLAIEPGQLTAVIGPSGAGKSTLLRALAGITPAQTGRVRFSGPAEQETGIGFVPQDDILHGELPLRRTLRYAATLRMRVSRAAIDAAVHEAMDMLGLAAHADVPVQSLSGGQRKRANIACEILTRPGVCFLDEPTSGLDPAAAADIVDHLQRMCAAGSTVVFTTHSVADIERSDQVVVLAPGGRIVAVGAPDQVLDRLGEETFARLFERLTAVPALGVVHLATTDAAAATDAALATNRPDIATTSTGERPTVARPGAVQQWWTLTWRAADILTRNRLTIAILLGSPAAVIAMFAVLFRAHGLDAGAADPTAAVQVAYWLSFSGFFFGLTFGLLQVCTEVPMLRRERYAGLRLSAYLGSKVTLLTPVLLLVNAVMIVVLRSLDRLPALSTGAVVELSVTMGLNAVAALCLGLLASAAVTSTAQAALALPMLCFPAVLFSGAMVPMSVMAAAGRAIAALMPDRWAFEAISAHLHVATLAGPGSPYAGLGASTAATYWMLLSVFTLVLACGAYAAIGRRAGRRQPQTRGR